jgi:hypothetical protein
VHAIFQGSEASHPCLLSYVDVFFALYLLCRAVLLPGYMPDEMAAGVAIDASMVPQQAFEINAEICPYGEGVTARFPLVGSSTAAATAKQLHGNVDMKQQTARLTSRRGTAAVSSSKSGKQSAAPGIAFTMQLSCPSGEQLVKGAAMLRNAWPPTSSLRLSLLAGCYNNGTKYYCPQCPLGSTTPWMGPPPWMT